MRKQHSKPSPGLFRLIGYSGISLWWPTLGLLSLLVYSVLVLAPYALVFYHIDTILNQGIGVVQTDSLQQAVVLVLWITLALFVLAYVGGLCCQYTGLLLIKALRLQLSRRISNLPPGITTNRNAMEIRRIIYDDLDTVSDFLGQQLPEIVKAVSVPLLVISGLFYLDWRLALVSLLPLPVILLVISYSAKKKRHYGLRQGFFDKRTAMDHAMMQFINAMPAIKNYGISASSLSNYSQCVEDFRQFMHLWIDTMIPHWSRYFSFLANASLPVIAIGLWLYINERLGLNVFLLFILLGSAATRPLFALANTGSQLALIHDIDSRLEPLYQQEVQKKKEQVLQNYSFKIRNLNYSYGSYRVLHDISADVKEGSCTAIAGPSGSGKTTLARLMAGLVAQESGSIELGGVQLADIGDAEQGKLVSFAFQQAMLFGINLADNISLGLDVSEEQLEQAAKKACCHDFICELEHGYQTIIGTDQAQLSGGQVQRIQLARAILKNAPILILDEATAFTDADNERAIQQAIEHLTACHTLIVITHRLKTLMHADRILVLDKGHLAGSGSHRQLLQNCKTYKDLWRSQNDSEGWQVR